MTDPGSIPVRWRPALLDAAVVTVWFLVLGVVGAVIWELVTPLAEYTRIDDNGILDERELSRQFGATGWFVVIAAAGGALSGFILLLWRDRSPVLMVVLVGLGGALASLAMAQVGLVLGPQDPQQVLPRVDVGDKVPLQLEVEGFGVYLAWSIFALAGALVALWGAESWHRQQAERQIPEFDLPRNG